MNKFMFFYQPKTMLVLGILFYSNFISSQDNLDNSNANEKMKIYYEEDSLYNSNFLFDDQVIYYFVDSDKNIFFYDNHGKRINFQNDLFELVPRNSTEIQKQNLLNIFISPKAIDYQKFDFPPKPFDISVAVLLKNISKILTNHADIENKGRNITEKTHLLISISEKGMIEGIENISPNFNPVQTEIIKYLNSIKLWTVPLIDGKATTCIFEIQVYTKINFDDFVDSN